MIISEREIYQLAFNRDMSDNLLLDTQIQASSKSWIVDYVGESFAKIIETNQGGELDELIESYVKPILAFGTLHDNFYHITMNITDKGVIQMLIEGTANVMSDTRLATAKREIKSTIFRMLENMDLYCKGNEIEGYEGLKLETSHFRYQGSEKFNRIRY